jgi:hypothetical protein
MRGQGRHLVHAMGLTVVLAALPVAAIETTPLPAPAALSTESGFATGQDAAIVPVQRHLDAISAVRSDPITLPIAAIGALALMAAMLTRRRHRRRAAWGYVPAEALPQRMRALLH